MLPGTIRSGLVGQRADFVPPGTLLQRDRSDECRSNQERAAEIQAQSAIFPSGRARTTGMHHAQLTESIRRRVAAAFARLGAPHDAELRESILIRDGAYCGRRFDGPLGHAIWFVEEDQLKFYRLDGSVARVTEPVTGLTVGTRIAA